MSRKLADDAAHFGSQYHRFVRLQQQSDERRVFFETETEELVDTGAHVVVDGANSHDYFDKDVRGLVWALIDNIGNNFVSGCSCCCHAVIRSSLNLLGVVRLRLTLGAKKLSSVRL